MANSGATDNPNIEYNIVTLFERLDDIRRDTRTVPRLLPAKAELRTLELWRSVISECLASFFYVFTVCGAAAGVVSGGSTAQTVLASSLASGFAMTAITQAFGHVSGAHVNPAVSVAMALTRNISLLRGFMFVLAQCGGGIAGAALLYGVTVPTKQSTLSATVAQLPAHLSPWERFGLELILTFLVVFVYFVTWDSHRRWLAGAPTSIGSVYLATTIVSMPSLNPARALGPAFVMNKWENHWVYWFGPLFGGIAAGLIYEFIFNPKRHQKRSKDSIDGDSSSIHSDEDTYDELDKPRSTYNTLRSVHPGSDLYRPVGTITTTSPNGGPGYCTSMAPSSLYSGVAPCKERGEPLYGGTKSLYCKSPPLTRANLNRSQSVYAKTGPPPLLHRGTQEMGGLPRPGPLVPAQSLYPMRLNSVSSTTTSASASNQNQQNQQRLGAEGIYGSRPNPSGPSGNINEKIYGQQPPRKYTPSSSNRPDSVYTSTQQPPRLDSADSSYGSYQSRSDSQSTSYQSSRHEPQGCTNSSTPTYQTRNEVLPRSNYAQIPSIKTSYQNQSNRSAEQDSRPQQDHVVAPPPPYMHHQTNDNPQY